MDLPPHYFLKVTSIPAGVTQQQLGALFSAKGHPPVDVRGLRAPHGGVGGLAYVQFADVHSATAALAGAYIVGGVRLHVAYAAPLQAPHAPLGGAGAQPLGEQQQHNLLVVPVNAVPPTPPAEPTVVHVLIDHSNVMWSGPLAADGVNHLPVDVEALVNLVVPPAAAALPGARFVAGSSEFPAGQLPLSQQAVWKKYRELGFEAAVLHRPWGKEQGVDQTLMARGYKVLQRELQDRLDGIAAMASDSFGAAPVRARHKLVIVTGCVGAPMCTRRSPTLCAA